MVRIWDDASYNSNDSKRVDFQMRVVYGYLIFSDRNESVVLLVNI
jgi:hypothetical protein